MKQRYLFLVSLLLLLSVNISLVFADDAGSITTPYGVGQTIETISQRFKDSEQIPFTLRVESCSMGETAETLAKKVYGSDYYNYHSPSSSEQWIVIKIYVKNNSNRLSLEIKDIYNDIYGLQLYNKSGDLISGIPTNIRKDYTFTNLLDISDVNSKKDTLNPGESCYLWCGTVVSKSHGIPLFRVMNGIDETSAITMHTYIYFNLDPASKYQITYNLNGGVNNANNPKYYYSYGQITLEEPTRTGYSFQGWYSDKNLTQKVTGIAKGSKGDKVVYAKWKVNKYTIEYSGNGATSGKMNASDATYDKTVTLRANSFKRTDYVFAGWNTKKDGTGKSYADKAQVKNLTSSNNATVTLYAQWTKTYTVYFNGNGATSGKMSALTGCKYGKDIVIPAVVYKKTGYQFAGWNTRKDGTGTTYKDSDTVSNLTKGNSITLYAQWRIVNYSITYVCYSGKNHSKNRTTYTIKDRVVLNDPQKDGYTFEGWYKDSSFKKRVSSIPSGSTGNITLYAKWVLTPLEITTITYSDRVEIRWERNPVATRYEVYRSTNKNSGYKKISDVTKGYSYTDKSALAEGKVYYYRVRVVATNNNKTIYSKYSNIGTAKKTVIPKFSAKILNKVNTVTNCIEILFYNNSNKYMTVRGNFGAYMMTPGFDWHKGNVWMSYQNYENHVENKDLVYRPGMNYRMYIALPGVDTISKEGCASFIFEYGGVEYYVLVYVSGNVSCGVMW